MTERAAAHRRHPGLAIHVCADELHAEPYRRWPPLVSARDTVERTTRMCHAAGIVEQRMLIGPHATRAALRARLAEAARSLAAHGVLLVTFSGHTERGAGRIEDARWCLCDAPIAIAEVADRLARVPSRARVIVIADTCYAAAIRRVVHGPQPCLVIAGCGEDQTMFERARSEHVVRLEAALAGALAEDSVRALASHLADDTPDAERPCVWTNSPAWWTAPPLALRECQSRCG